MESPKAHPEIPPFVLASGSPRRKSLLEEAGLDFRVVTPDDSAECGLCSGENSAELVARLAFQKCANVAEKIDSGFVLAADTVADCYGQILGKPRDADHARVMLSTMSGKQHRVLTGVCLWHRPDNKHLIDVDITTLIMDELSNEVLDRYIESDQWIGKAGAFGFQDGLDWVKIVKGEESNVVGLPMPKVYDLFAQLTHQIP